MRIRRKLRSAARIAWSLLVSTPLPPKARLVVLGLKLEQGLGRIGLRSEPVALPVGIGSVYLGPRSIGRELWTVEEIFLRGDPYATEYTGATVVDIGGHKGYFAAYAFLRGAGEVISYEPSASNYEALERAAGSFRHSNREWTTVRAAVAGTAGTATLALANETLGNSLLPLPESGIRRSIGGEIVEMVTLPQILAGLELRGAGRLIVKIDAEGTECDIVGAMEPSHWSPVSEVFIEHHPFAPCARHDLVDALAAAGFRLGSGSGGKDEVLHFLRR